MLFLWVRLQPDSYARSRICIFNRQLRPDRLRSLPHRLLFVDASFGNPLTMMQQGASMQWTVNVPALAANTSQRVSVATVSVPNNMQDWDLVLVGTADPPTVAQPVRGLISESDETNNVKNHACRWFGPTPDTSLQACN